VYTFGFMSLLLSVHQLSKSFAGKELFKGVSFGIEEKERVALLGPNGVGKSTLMKILTNNLTSDSGSVVYRRGMRMAYLPQTPVFKADDTLCSLLLNNYDMEGDKLALAYEWMGRLELSQFAEDTSIVSMSGGWQKRVALAEQILKDPDLLLLDEPTNHLDVAGIKWLEDFLCESRFACLIITHDRLFLQRVSQKILDLDPRFPGHLLSVEGDYQKYLEIKSLMAADQMAREQKMTNTLRREKEWLARGAKARQTKQQARIDEAGKLADEVQRLQTLNKRKLVDLSFEAGEKGPKKLIVSKDLGKKSFTGENSWLFRHLDFILTPKTRLALLGTNGAGKSTLIKTLLGLLPAEEGQVKLAEALRSAYFEQDRGSLDPKKSVLHNICPEGDYVDFRGRFVHVRSYLEKFKFYKDKLDLPVSQLSGGECARLRIAQMMLKECQVLVLDEPTNDLDIETLNVLEEALRDFEGAVILVTHDRYFMDQVCTQILSFDGFQPELGELLFFANYEQWENWYEVQLALIKAKKSAVKNKSSSSSDKNSASTGKKLSNKEKFELEQMEERVLKTEQKITQLQQELASPEVVSQAMRVQELYTVLHKEQQDLEKIFQRWSELEARAKA
jgi:ATP-binding cassette subfamily F protein uup